MNPVENMAVYQPAQDVHRRLPMETSGRRRAATSRRTWPPRRHAGKSSTERPDASSPSATRSSRRRQRAGAPPALHLLSAAGTRSSVQVDRHPLPGRPRRLPRWGRSERRRQAADAGQAMRRPHRRRGATPAEDRWLREHLDEAPVPAPSAASATDCVADAVRSTGGRVRCASSAAPSSS